MADSASSSLYTALNLLSVSVVSTKSVVALNKDVSCSLAGSSIPLAVSVTSRPWSDVSVNLALVAYNQSVANAVDPSHGMTVSEA